jgi:hypothetical protein
MSKLMTQGLSQKQLCEYFGWEYKTIAKEAKAKGLSTHAYVQQKTGWILQQERYYQERSLDRKEKPNWISIA